MPLLPSAEAAAHNNALWCDAVCRAHGLPTAIDGALWRCLRPAPPFYPNAVTLVADARAEQLAAIEALIGSGLPGSWAVKDSFAALDLRPLGFAPLFDATWIGRPPGAPLAPQSGLRWRAVRSAQELARWEAAWAGEEEAPSPRLFPPALPADSDILFLAGVRGEEIVAGAILNRSGAGATAAVGLSNAFAAPQEDARACWAEATAAANNFAPGLPVVGYEQGEPLAWALAAGFTALHPLRVWVRKSEGTEGTEGTGGIDRSRSL